MPRQLMIKTGRTKPVSPSLSQWRVSTHTCAYMCTCVYTGNRLLRPQSKDTAGCLCQHVVADENVVLGCVFFFKICVFPLGASLRYTFYLTQWQHNRLLSQKQQKQRQRPLLTGAFFISRFLFLKNTCLSYSLPAAQQMSSYSPRPTPTSGFNSELQCFRWNSSRTSVKRQKGPMEYNFG